MQFSYFLLTKVDKEVHGSERKEKPTKMKDVKFTEEYNAWNNDIKATPVHNKSNANSRTYLTNNKDNEKLESTVYMITTSNY